MRIKLTLRLPEGIWSQLRECAERSGRSLNAEIVWRLRRSLDGYRQ